MLKYVVNNKLYISMLSNRLSIINSKRQLNIYVTNKISFLNGINTKYSNMYERHA